VACAEILVERPLLVGPPMFTLHHDLPAMREAAPRARWLVADALTSSAAPAVSSETLYNAQLLVSELVTNAVTHARTDLHLGMTSDGMTLVITVADGHPHVPAVPSISTTVDFDECGRGMTIVASIADDFGWQQRPGGKGKIMWISLLLIESSSPAAPPQQHRTEASTAGGPVNAP
jgi:anti-sigma regulatory factor (Ser/Thr protein kinase)